MNKDKLDKILSTIKLWKNRPYKTRSIKRQLSQKNSIFRNTLCSLLKLWREYRSLAIIAKIVQINKKKLSDTLQKYSRAYKDRRHRTYGTRLMRHIDKERNKNKKHSEYRNKIAYCLRTWKKLRSVTETSKALKMKKFLVTELLNQSNHYSNRKKYTTREKEYANIWSLKLRVIKILGEKCKKCGNNNPMVLELHHLNEKTKENCFSDMIRKKINIRNLFDEIKKCKLLCRNCHQEVHNKNKHPKNLKNKKFILKILKNNGKCDVCGYKRNISCLEFHHRRPSRKEFGISQLTDPRRNYQNMKISKEKFRNYIKEIKKCNTLCCNCHQLQHINIKKFNKLRLLIRIMERLIGKDYVVGDW